MAISERSLRKLAQDQIGGPLRAIHVQRDGQLLYVLVSGRDLYAVVHEDKRVEDLRLGLRFRKVKR